MSITYRDAYSHFYIDGMMTTDHDVYQSNLRCLVDALLYDQPSSRSSMIVHRLRHSLLASAQNPMIPFNADYAMKASYDNDVPDLEINSINPRQVPLNSVIAAWDYSLKEDELEPSWEPEPLTVKEDNRDYWLVEEMHPSARHQDNESNKLVEISAERHCSDMKRNQKGSYHDLEAAQVDKNSKRCQGRNKLKEFSESVWKRFISGNNSYAGCSQDSKRRKVEPEARTCKANSKEDSSLMDALRNLSNAGNIFLACLCDDGSTNMHQSTNDCIPTELLIAIFADDHCSNPMLFTHRLSAETSDKPEQSVITSILNTDAVKVAFDLKCLFRWIFSTCSPAPNFFTILKGTFFDLKLAAWLLYTDIPTDGLTFDSISYRMRCNDLIKLQKHCDDLEMFPNHIRDDFSELSLQYRGMLQIQKQQNRRLVGLVNFESKIALILATMEHFGVEINLEYLRSQRAKIREHLHEIEQRCYDIVGHDFNLSSPEQIARVLYDELRLSAPVPMASGHRSTAESVLESLREEHDLPASIIQHRALSKIVGTYIEPLIVAGKSNDGVVRTSWNQHICATGRLSSSGPNLQSLPKEVESVICNEEVENYTTSIRRAFVCDEKFVLISADYKQMEVRVFALLSKDEQLTRAIVNAYDVYQILAGMVFNKPSSAVNASEKSQAKTMFLALMYGMGPSSLSKQLSTLTKRTFNVAEAGAFSKKIISQFPQLQQFSASTIAFCRRHGYVETITGRRRYLPDINSNDVQKRRQAERQAVNSVIQGSSSDVMKCAMLKLVLLLERHSLSSTTRIRLQVHDELVVSCPSVAVNLVSELVAEAMQENDMTKKLNGRLQVSVQVGKNLSDLKALDGANMDL